MIPPPPKVTSSLTAFSGIDGMCAADGAEGAAAAVGIRSASVRPINVGPLMSCHALTEDPAPTGRGPVRDSPALCLRTTQRETLGAWVPRARGVRAEPVLRRGAGKSSPPVHPNQSRRRSGGAGVMNGRPLGPGRDPSDAEAVGEVSGAVAALRADFGEAETVLGEPRTGRVWRAGRSRTALATARSQRWSKPQLLHTAAAPGSLAASRGSIRALAMSGPYSVVMRWQCLTCGEYFDGRIDHLRRSDVPGEPALPCPARSWDSRP